MYRAAGLVAGRTRRDSKIHATRLATAYLNTKGKTVKRDMLREVP